MTIRSMRMRPRRKIFPFAFGGCLAVLAGSWSCSAAATGGADAPPGSSGVTFTGFAFVDSSVTGMGSRAQLPPGTKIHPPGSKITGSEGCPTTRYRTDGLLVAVMDYNGRPTAGSVRVIRLPKGGGKFTNAPYYLDFDTGRKLQYLGPIFENGTYELAVSYDFAQGQEKSTSAKLVLARSCPAVD